MQTREELERAREARSKRYGIGIKEGGNLTIPSEHRTRWPGISDDDYLDPVNYRYPCPNAEQTAVAARYWGQEDNRSQYTREEQAIISRRLEEKKKKFKIGEYRETANKELWACAGPKRVSSEKEIQLLPYGRVVTDKGEFLVDEESIRMIIEAFNLRVNDMVVDYEHQTLKDMIAPAAGWISELIDRGKEGLWAKVKWTERAADLIRNDEYRYISPVISVRKSDGRVIAVHSAGLTNTPAIDGMAPLAAKKTLKEEGIEMDFLKRLALKLGLAEDANEGDIEKAVDQAIEGSKAGAKLVAHKDVLGLLELPEGASLEEVKAKILSLKNPSGYVRVEEFNALKQRLQMKERDELVAKALESGKVAPAQRAWAEEYALKDPAGFKAFLEVAPVVVPVGKEIAGSKDGRKPEGIDEIQTMVNKLLGISNEQFKKYVGGDMNGANS